MAAASDNQPRVSKCKLCKLISCGHLNEAITYLEDTDIMTYVSKTAVYLSIKHYSQFLTDYAQRNGLSPALTWNSTEIKDCPTRVNVIKILKLLFKAGLPSEVAQDDETPLMCAISTHDECLVRIFMENGADPNAMAPANKMNAVALAVILNEATILKLILSYGAVKVNDPCCQSLTPLQVSMNKSVEVSKLLLQNGADVQQVMQMRGSNDVLLSKPPLVHAVDTDNLYLASILLEHGEDINQCFGECSNSPIHFAVLRGNEDMVKLLIQYGANLDKRNRRGHTALGLALLQDDTGKAISEALLCSGCSWKKTSMISVFQRHFPPLHIASFLGYDFHHDIIKCFLNKARQAEEQPNAHYHNTPDVDSPEGTPFQHLDVRRKLSLIDSRRIDDLQKEEKQEFINTQALDKSTALFMAVLGGNLRIAKYLYINGADPYLVCILGNLLHASVMASKMGENMLTFALHFNFDMDMLNDDGNTPLTLAARNGNQNLCRMLVERGAMLNIRDGRFGETALSVSIYFGFEDNAETLICHGANPDIPDARDTKALYWAIFNCRERALRLLLAAGAKMTHTELANYPKNIKVMKNPALKALLKEYVGEPFSLQQCCRLTIRKQLIQVHAGKSIMAAVMSLPVPQKLKDFIALMTH